MTNWNGTSCEFCRKSMPSRELMPHPKSLAHVAIFTVGWKKLFVMLLKAVNFFPAPFNPFYGQTRARKLQKCLREVQQMFWKSSLLLKPFSFHLLSYLFADAFLLFWPTWSFIEVERWFKREQTNKSKTVKVAHWPKRKAELIHGEKGSKGITRIKNFLLEVLLLLLMEKSRKLS